IFHLEIFRRFVAGSPSTSGRRLYSAGQLADVKSALEWGISHRDTEAMGVGIAAASAPFFLEFAVMSGCARWDQRALEVIEETANGTSVGARLKSALGLTLTHGKCERERARLVLERGLRRSERPVDVRSELQALANINALLQKIGECSLSLRYAERRM